MRLILLVSVFLLHIDGGSTRGDSLDVTVEPWTEPAESNIKELLSEINAEISHRTTQSNDNTEVTQAGDKITTQQFPTTASGMLQNQRRKEYKLFSKIIRMPMKAPSPTMTVNGETVIPITEQVRTTSQVKDVQQGLNHAPRQNYYNKNNQKPSFETVRGKNWCAYVHTRLLPTVTVDNVESYVSGGANPCAWNTGACLMRSRIVSQPVYRMKHKIVTSLEWKCCPGYSGDQCKATAQNVQVQVQSNQAESNAVGNTVDSEQRKTAEYDQALQQKLTEQIYNQEIKLTLLNRNVENISLSLSKVHTTLDSLEEKINDADKGNNLQAFLKELKTKSITELIKEIVKDQFTVLQTSMKETVAQLYKSISEMSLEVEKTKEFVKILNHTIISTHEKCSLEEDNKATMNDVLELKNRVEQLKNKAFVCTTSFEEIEKKHTSLERELEHEKSRNRDYFQSLNSTLNKIKEIHEEMLTEEQNEEQKVSPLNEPMEDNITEYLLVLQNRLKKQNIMMLQLYDDINSQDRKINNLTITLDLQKQSIEKSCEDRFSSCKDDFQKQLKGTNENMHVLNETVSNVVLPLDDKIDKMNEQISDLCYDMEILQPLIEKGAPFSMTTEYEHRNDIEEITDQIKNITEFLNHLGSKVQELNKGKEELRNEAEEHELMFERRINECLIEVEDGFNNTMDILNNAVDSIHDNFVRKSTMSDMENVVHLYHNTTTKMLESIMVAIPLLNKTLQNLVNGYRSQQDDLFNLDNSKGFTRDRNDLFTYLQLFQKVSDMQSKLDQYQLNMTQLQEKLQASEMNVKNCRSEVQSLESQLNMMLANRTASLKTTKDEVVPKEKVQQDVYSRIKALEFKSVRLSTSIPLVNKTANEAKGLCQTVFITVKKVNESVPQLIKAAQPNIASVQKGFEDLIISLMERKAATILSNVTSYIDRSLSELTNNNARLQKQVKAPVKKPIVPKKIAVNPTASVIGRSQRNTDVVDQDDYSSCRSSPCLNGGTCINDMMGFVCACRHPFGGVNCSLKMSDENSQSLDFSKGSYRYAPMVAFYVSHTYGMTSPGPIRFNNLYVNYGSSYAPSTGKFHVPYLGVYVFKFTIESYSHRVSGYLVVDGLDKIAFQSENINSSMYSDRMVTGDALLELNYGQEVWLRLTAGSIPAQYPPITTFSGYLLYRT